MFFMFLMIGSCDRPVIAERSHRRSLFPGLAARYVPALALWSLVALASASIACDDPGRRGGTVDAGRDGAHDDGTETSALDTLQPSDTRQQDSSDTVQQDLGDTGSATHDTDTASNRDTTASADADLDALEADSAERDGDAVDTATSRRACASESACPITVPCESDGYCREVECHLGRLGGAGAPAIPDQPCPDGQVCDLLVEDTAYTWTCVASAGSCSFDDTCPFGQVCRQGACVHAECTVGSSFSQWGPRPCEGSEVCACMDDGVELNGGRGECVPLDGSGEPDMAFCH